MNRIKNLLLTMVAVLALAIPSFAQTATTSTTLSSAITDTSSRTMIVASATGFTAGTTLAYVDNELVEVTSVSGTTIGIRRGAGGRVGTHASGATVYVGPKGQGPFIQYVPSGTCTRSDNPYLPLINYAPSVSGFTIFDCFGSSWYGKDQSMKYALSLAPGAQPSATSPTAGAANALTAQAGGAQSATTNNGANGGAWTITSGVGGAGGSSSGNGGTGGAMALVAGAGGGTITGGTGGAASLTGGAGGAGSTTAGTGGAVAITGGAAATTTAGTAGVGGAITITTGAGSATTSSGGTGGAAGAMTIAGGVGGAASTGAATGGAGGAVAIAGGAGAGTITGGAGGAVTITGGAGANGSTAGGSGGDVTLRAGAAGTGGTGTAGKVKLNDAATASKVLAFDLSGATSSTTTTLAFSQPGNITLTAPGYAGGIPVMFSCGATGTGNQTCTATAANTKTQIYNGQSTLSSNAATITFPNAFTSTTSFFCVANDVTTRANPVQMVPASASTATITNTTGGSDVIQWICIGQ